jgi:hypothetical protein
MGRTIFAGALRLADDSIERAKLNIDVLFQNALWRKQHQWGFPYARDVIHGDGRSGVTGVGIKNNGEL